MSIDISKETEAKLLAKAQEQGISVDALLQRLLNDTAAMPIECGAEIPRWDLGAAGTLRRTDIYDDIPSLTSQQQAPKPATP